MGIALILAEKPDAAKKMASAFSYTAKNGYYEVEKCSTFPDGAYVTFAIGHLVELIMPEEYDPKYKKWRLEDLPIIPEKFKYKVIDGQERQFNVIKQLANDPKVKDLVIATDAGREGELIGVSILKLTGVYGKKPIKRLWVSSMTKEAFRKGFDNLLDGSQTVNYYHEAYARSVSDYLVGLNVTRAATIHLQNAGFGNQGVFSVGRVQTPVLKIIVDREREIENFIAKPFWTIQAEFDIKGNGYKAKWYREVDGEKLDQFIEKEKAEEVLNFCKNKPAEILEVIKERKSVKPPRLHSLSTLQTLAGKKFKYSPSKTLDIAQKLYTDGYISYPRSDSNAITKQEAKQFPSIFTKLSKFSQFAPFLPTPIKSEDLSSRYVDPSKVSDHYALIPTQQVPDISKLSKDEMNIYEIVVRSVIAAHYEDSIFDHTSIVTEVDNKEKFSTKGKVLVKEGWRKVIYPSGIENDREDNKKEEEEDSLLPKVQKGEQGITKKVELKAGKTTSKPRLTSSGLINVMKYPAKFMDSGEFDEEKLENEISAMAIGTEATRAGIIETLRKRNFIEVKRNKVYSTEKGKILIDALGSSTLLCSPVLTAKWETVLANIGKGKFRSNDFIERGKSLTISLLDNLEKRTGKWNFSQKAASINKKESLGSCPLCGSNVVDKGKFYGCEGYQTKGCKFGLNHTINKKKISTTQIKKLLKNGRTDEIKGFVSKNDKKYDAFFYWNEEEKRVQIDFIKKRSEAKIIGHKCPFCSSQLTDRGKFIGCTGFKDGCKFTISKETFGRKLKDSEIRAILENGKTELITDFVGKYGAFKGWLIVDEKEKKVRVEVKR
ncbi:DNA topoisomerase 3 [Virgibacillus halodenitrificans]|uniref:DNA topoisomerase 3 n=1 Tax=Virgibacillus halodenitrificans TaxID=1482 RepID=UPI000EF490F9|nr:DNA topoisomerase 3 [Virgibacillus halodenitrificans]